MKFLKKIGKALFGSSESKKVRGSKKKVAKKKAPRAAKKKIPKTSARKTVRSKGKTRKTKTLSKKQPRMIKAALAALPVAEVTHYFPHVNAAVLKIKTGDIRIGDELQFKGHTTDFKQRVVSMQIDHAPVKIAKKGDDFGVEVNSRVRAGDLVFKKER